LIELRRPPGQFARVGHRGAPAVAPENTLRSLEAAVDLGCDMLEFDVLPLHDGRLVLAHSRRELPEELATLADALELCAERFPQVGLQLDLKRRGMEHEVAALLRRSGVRERAWVSAFDAGVLRRFAAVDPELPRSYTLSRDRFGLWRASLPRRIPGLLRRSKANALTLHHSLVSAAAIRCAHELGAAVYLWTVNDRVLLQTFVDAEADGIISDDPRIFSALTT
jgi:glycerophosphoryl diester phosphodiesterase